MKIRDDRSPALDDVKFLRGDFGKHGPPYWAIIEALKVSGHDVSLAKEYLLAHGMSRRAAV